MNHIEAHRLLQLAEMSAIVGQPEMEHIKNCDDCSMAFLQLRNILLKRCVCHEPLQSSFLQ